MRRTDPDYVAGRKGRYTICVPIVHPPFCRCAVCAARRPADAWDRPFVHRIRRVSPHPDSRLDSARYARETKAREEAALRSAIEDAAAKGAARPNEPTVAKVAAAYREHLRKEGKRFDRDQYRINAIEAHFGAERDPRTISKADYRAWCEELRKTTASSTILRYTNTLLAMLNNAKRDEIIDGHQLTDLKKPRARTTRKPETFSRKQVEVLLGKAMDAFEAEQALANAEARRDARGRLTTFSYVPMRGLVLVAFLTLMRPENNVDLRWDQLEIDPVEDRGRFRLERHKNAAKGVNVEGPLHPELVRYLRRTPEAERMGLVHPNPETGQAYRNIRKQWSRLLSLANAELEREERITGGRRRFYTWRHTGASLYAELGADPVMIARMMGDTQLATVMRHYFDSSIDHMQEVVGRLELPTEPIREEAAN